MVRDAGAGREVVKREEEEEEGGGGGGRMIVDQSTGGQWYHTGLPVSALSAD